MDDVVHRLAREVAEAIGAGVSEDPAVEACREKARAAGFDMRISLEAIIGFGSHDGSQALAKVTAPTHAQAPASDEETPKAEMTANDRRFLRSLRIAADDPLNQKVE